MNDVVCTANSVIVKWISKGLLEMFDGLSGLAGGMSSRSAKEYRIKYRCSCSWGGSFACAWSIRNHNSLDYFLVLNLVIEHNYSLLAQLRNIHRTPKTTAPKTTHTPTSAALPPVPAPNWSHSSHKVFVSSLAMCQHMPAGHCAQSTDDAETRDVCSAL